MKVNAPEVIPLHLSRDGPADLHPDPQRPVPMEADLGPLVPMEIDTDMQIPMELEPVRIVEKETQAYKGPTVATPRVGSEVVLPTKGYKLLKDITVQEVQISTVHGPGGGLVYQIE